MINAPGQLTNLEDHNDLVQQNPPQKPYPREHRASSKEKSKDLSFCLAEKETKHTSIVHTAGTGKLYRVGGVVGTSTSPCLTNRLLSASAPTPGTLPSGNALRRRIGPRNLPAIADLASHMTSLTHSRSNCWICTRHARPPLLSPHTTLRVPCSSTMYPLK